MPLTSLLVQTLPMLLLLSMPVHGLDASSSARVANPRGFVTGQQPLNSGIYRAPVSGSLLVLNAFDSLAGKYQAGHRGVDLASASTSPVLAAGSGTVRFAGNVAGRGVVVVLHPDGISTEYEPLSVLVRTGEHVIGGQIIGRVSGAHVGCSRTCLHWGAKRAGNYFDPMSLLRPLGPVRLVPCQARGWAC